MFLRFWTDPRAATAIEYCLIAGAVSIAIVLGATSIGTKLSTRYYGPVATGLR